MNTCYTQYRYIEIYVTIDIVIVTSNNVLSIHTNEYYYNNKYCVHVLYSTMILCQIYVHYYIYFMCYCLTYK